MTLKTLLGAACAITALGAGLAGCSDNRATAGQTISLSGGSKYCSPFQKTSTNGPAAAPVMASGDPAAAFEDCLHRWSYALAPARDELNKVKRAAPIGAFCDSSKPQ